MPPSSPPGFTGSVVVPPSSPPGFTGSVVVLLSSPPGFTGSVVVPLSSLPVSDVSAGFVVESPVLPELSPSGLGVISPPRCLLLLDLMSGQN